MKTLALLGLAAFAGLALVAPPAAPMPQPNVCLSYWYCIPQCWEPPPPDNTCWCRPECAPEAALQAPAALPRMELVLP
jgi:hypothetical protein